MRTFFKQSSLSLFFALIFLLSLLGQAIAGRMEFNATQYADGLGLVSFWQYVASADFAVDVTENWQSEFLQFLLFITATIWFVQKGSPESKALDKVGLGSDKDQKLGRYAEPDSPRWARVGGVRTTVFSWSLTLTMAGIFLACWAVQAVAGWAAFNETRFQNLQDPLTLAGYLGAPEFWSRSLQNWQSEFLAVGSMAVLSVYLRQRGSSESKPVGEPHSTGES